MFVKEKKYKEDYNNIWKAIDNNSENYVSVFREDILQSNLKNNPKFLDEILNQDSEFIVGHFDEYVKLINMHENN